MGARPRPHQASREEGGSEEGPSSRRLPRVRFEGTFGAVGKPPGLLSVCAPAARARRWARRPRLSLSSGPHESIKAPTRACVALTPAPWERTRRWVRCVYLRPIYSGGRTKQHNGRAGSRGC